MSDHLDLLGLDAVRAGEAEPAQAAHALACPGCRADVDRLRGLAARLAPLRIDVPAALSRSILPRRRPWLAVAAAAALLAAGLTYTMLPAHPRSPDMVDAYLLALEIRGGKGRDINADGRVDERDVDALASRAVSLAGGAR